MTYTPTFTCDDDFAGRLSLKARAQGLISDVCQVSILGPLERAFHG